MRLYFPGAKEETLEVSWGNKKRKVRLEPPDGVLDLALIGVPYRVPFTVSKEDKELFTTSQEELRHLENSVRLVKATLCLGVHNEGTKLIPVAPVTTLSLPDNDRLILFAELAGVDYRLPLFISWWYQGEAQFGIVARVPPLPSEVGGKRVLRSCAFGFRVPPDLPVGRWELRVDLLTGRKLCWRGFRLQRKEIMNERGRAFLHITTTISVPRGGRILDELG
ncbi:hypothetical protein [Desulfothermobacter acidiphilus]|uniref:hypothetical protein n=1 Tax=Desulfothermobacter acidiphilus TaxID=1938353 RepID=UPI003F8AAF93